MWGGFMAGKLTAAFLYSTRIGSGLAASRTGSESFPPSRQPQIQTERLLTCARLSLRELVSRRGTTGTHRRRNTSIIPHRDRELRGALSAYVPRCCVRFSTADVAATACPPPPNGSAEKSTHSSYHVHYPPTVFHLHPLHSRNGTSNPIRPSTPPLPPYP